MPNLDETQNPDGLPCDPESSIAATPVAEVIEMRASPSWLEHNLPLSLDAYEKAALERALVETWGDAAEAAELLGIGRSTFYRKAGKLGIHLGRVRPALPPLSPEAERENAPDPAGVGPSQTLG